MKRKALAIASLSGVLAAGLIGLAAAPASAQDLTCTSSIGAITHDGDVVVPANATCNLSGTKINGNIKVYAGATLTASGVSVGGSVQGDGHAAVSVSTSSVTGSIQLKQGGGGQLIGNTVTGDIQLLTNTGQFTVNDNRVGGNLLGKDNTPAPVGAGNAVNGTAEGQCVGMAGIPSTPTNPSPVPSSSDGDVTCTSSLGAIRVGGNVVVPRGRKCALNGTTVDGNVLVKKGATLKAMGVRVDGNIQGNLHKRVVVGPRNGKKSLIDGNIQLKRGGGGVLASNVVDGDIQVFSNKGRFTIVKNTVDGNLQCKSNKPGPTGKGNKVKGNKEGQCRSL